MPKDRYSDNYTIDCIKDYSSSAYPGLSLTTSNGSPLYIKSGNPEHNDTSYGLGQGGIKMVSEGYTRLFADEDIVLNSDKYIQLETRSNNSHPSNFPSLNPGNIYLLSTNGISLHSDNKTIISADQGTEIHNNSNSISTTGLTIHNPDNTGAQYILELFGSNSQRMWVDNEGNMGIDGEFSCDNLAYNTISGGDSNSIITFPWEAEDIEIINTSGDFLLTNSDASGDLEIGSARDITFASRNMFINATNDLGIVAEDHIEIESTGGHIMLITDWGGTSQTTVQFKDDTVPHTHSYPVQMEYTHDDGSILYLANKSTDNDSDGGILRLAHEDITANSVGIYKKHWITFNVSDRSVGKIRSGNSSEESTNNMEQNDAFFCIVGPCGGGGSVSSGDRDRQCDGDVAYISGGNDYGELIVMGDPEEWRDGMPEGWEPKTGRVAGLPEGLLVRVRGGKFWRGGQGTPMIITRRAVVIGNCTEEIENKYFHEILSFIGQVPAYVRGEVKEGDYLIATEGHYCVPVSPGECTFEQYKQAIGTAWESSPEGIPNERNHKVLCAVGIK